jgi:integrase
MRRRVDVKASASEAYGELQFVATKTYERRTVPIPKSLIDELAAQVAGRGAPDFVWLSPQGGPFRYSNWFKRHFKPAVVRAGLPSGTRFHDLRHSYAAMLIAQGAHPRAIMERMGHSTITVTLDTYGHLCPSLMPRSTMPWTRCIGTLVPCWAAAKPPASPTLPCRQPQCDPVCRVPIRASRPGS